MLCPAWRLEALSGQQPRSTTTTSSYLCWSKPFWLNCLFLVTQLEFLSSAFAAALSALAPCTAPFASNAAGGGNGATPSG